MRFFSSCAAGGQHRHRRGLWHRVWGERLPPAAPVVRPASALRLYVCVGKHCPGGRAVLDALRAAAAESGIVVEPCGCLDLCEQGPVAIALPADARPPRRGQPGVVPLARYCQLTPEEAPRIIAALQQRQN